MTKSRRKNELVLAENAGAEVKGNRICKREAVTEEMRRKKQIRRWKKGKEGEQKTETRNKGRLNGIRK